jgi:hypothetical protein
MSSSLSTAFRWHRPLMLVALLMVAVGAVSVIGLIVDPRELVGAPIWAKPLKFAISIFVYTITWAWLIHQLRRFRRIAWWSGTVIALALGVEMILVVGQTIRGHRSHFNVSNELDELVFNTMGGLIAVLWVATLIAAVLLWFSPPRDRARALAVRLGSAISVVGAGLGALMVIPSESQLDDFHGVVGAHTVGAEDGGPGLFLLGWSTEHGDLRIPHFLGMHALQLIPLALLLIELASRRVLALRDERTRVGIVASIGAGYAGLVALVTWQALRGQSIVAPDAATLLGVAVLAAVVASGCAVSLARGRSRAAAGFETRRRRSSAGEDVKRHSSDRAGV